MFIELSSMADCQWMVGSQQLTFEDVLVARHMLANASLNDLLPEGIHVDPVVDGRDAGEGIVAEQDRLESAAFALSTCLGRRGRRARPTSKRILTRADGLAESRLPPRTSLKGGLLLDVLLAAVQRLNGRGLGLATGAAAGWLLRDVMGSVAIVNRDGVSNGKGISWAVGFVAVGV